MKKAAVFISLALFFTVFGFGSGAKIIPFKMERNKIILPVRVGESQPLRIILDTGMAWQGLLLFDGNKGKELGLSGGSRYRIEGAGQGTTSYAFRSEGNTLNLNGIDFPDQAVVILQSDTLNGFPTDGVIGNTIFDSGIVHIDHDRKILHILRREEFKPDTAWTMIDLTFNENNIPCLEAAISIKGEAAVPVKLYIDSASSEALEMLVKEHMAFSLPDKLTDRHFGWGLSGEITGKIGRITSLRLGPYSLLDVLTGFIPVEMRSRQRGMDGVLSNSVLRRFNLIFDYKNAKLFLKPNNAFSIPFI